jgi:hypothetical protein
LVASWKEQARCELIDLRGASQAWGYRRKHLPCVEPTALACLALVASGDLHTSASDIETSQKGAEWLATIQRADGSLPVSESRVSPGWSTPYGLMLWGAVGGYRPTRLRARDWLLSIKGETVRRGEGADNIIGHDPSLAGWPWVSGTHSWVEPTTLAVLALCREGLAEHGRVNAGIQLILDRALDGGGWNCGSKSVFGAGLRAQPAPTGLALLALAARGDDSAAVENAAAYLRATLPDIRAAVSIGWGVLGLRAHTALPSEYETWLAEAHSQCSGRPDATMGLALLLLASSETGLSLLVTPSLTRS